MSMVKDDLKCILFLLDMCVCVYVHMYAGVCVYVCVCGWMDGCSLFPLPGVHNKCEPSAGRYEKVVSGKMERLEV